MEMDYILIQAEGFCTGRYNNRPLDAVKFCFGTIDNCVHPIEFDTPITSAVELFTGEYRPQGVGEDDLVSAISASLSVDGLQYRQDCDMLHPGFNTQCADGNHARWGFCNNIPSQHCEDTTDVTPLEVDSDGVIGIGPEGQDCCPMGAGYTNYFVHDVRDSGHEQSVQAWVLI